MALVVPNAAEQRILEHGLNKVAPENLRLKLFTNNVTPAEGDTEATYTEAADTGSGYAPISLVAADWTITPGAPTQASQPEKTWTFTGALGNVFGYYVVQVTSGKLLWAERFTDGPYNIQNNGDQIKVFLSITLE